MAAKIIDYTIHSGVCTSTVVDDVKVSLNSGWVLHGALTASQRYDGTVEYSQAMVKYAPPEPPQPIGFKDINLGEL